MGAVDTTYTFTATDTITSTKMNNIIDQTTMTADAIIGTTLEVASGKLKVRSQGITSNELSDLNVSTGKIADLAVTTGKIANDAVTYEKVLYANMPVQIVQAVKYDIQTINSTTTSWSDISGLSVTLTRAVASASGKVRIQAVIHGVTTSTNHGVAVRIVRDSTVIGVGDASGSRSQATSLSGTGGQQGSGVAVVDFIDSSPGSASTVSYKIQAKVYSVTPGYINRAYVDDNSVDYVFRTISTMTLTELSP